MRYREREREREKEKEALLNISETKPLSIYLPLPDAPFHWVMNELASYIDR